IFAFSSCQTKRTNENLPVGNNAANITSTDTLTITDNVAVDDPFGFGDRPLTFLLSDTSVTPEIKTEDYQVEGEATKQGTYFALKYDGDFFAFYKRSDSVEFCTNSELLTAKFSTKSGLKIGMTKKEVLKYWHHYKIQAIPNVVIIWDESMNSSIQFEFKNDRLHRIFYEPYFD
ncbi:MAG: hypothetical protein ACKO96_38290, partial [Flammeovirgaceae bacterium]